MPVKSTKWWWLFIKDCLISCWNHTQKKNRLHERRFVPSLASTVGGFDVRLFHFIELLLESCLEWMLMWHFFNDFWACKHGEMFNILIDECWLVKPQQILHDFVIATHRDTFRKAVKISVLLLMLGFSDSISECVTANWVYFIVSCSFRLLHHCVIYAYGLFEKSASNTRRRLFIVYWLQIEAF